MLPSHIIAYVLFSFVVFRGRCSLRYSPSSQLDCGAKLIIYAGFFSWLTFLQDQRLQSVKSDSFDAWKKVSQLRGPTFNIWNSVVSDFMTMVPLQVAVKGRFILAQEIIPQIATSLLEKVFCLCLVAFISLL